MANSNETMMIGSRRRWQRDVNIYGKIRFTFILSFPSDLRCSVFAVRVHLAHEQFLPVPPPPPPSDATKFIFIRFVWFGDECFVCVCGLCADGRVTWKTKNESNCCTLNSIVIGRTEVLLALFRLHLPSGPIFFEFLLHRHTHTHTREKPRINCFHHFALSASRRFSVPMIRWASVFRMLRSAKWICFNRFNRLRCAAFVRTFSNFFSPLFPQRNEMRAKNLHTEMANKLTI